MEVCARVDIDYGASEGEVRAVESLFQEAGVDVEVNPGVMQFSQVTPWVISIGVPLAAFVKKLAELAAEDAYLALKDFVRRARDARRLSGAPDGMVEIDDYGSRVSIKLTPDLPDEAYRELLELDLQALPSGFVGWHPDTQRWFHDSPAGKRELE